MAFVVEDGTGIPGANAYIEVAFADGYFSDRLDTEWTGTPEQKQAAIVLATDYMESRFGAAWVGCRLTETQGLGFPRVAPAGMPLGLQQACAEYAKRARVKPLAPDLPLAATGTVAMVTERTVGPITTKFAAPTHGPGSVVMLLQPYPTADMKLRGLVRNTSGRTVR